MSARQNIDPENRPNPARRTLLTGGAVGLAAVAGAALGGAQPASAQPMTQPVSQLLPSNPPDKSGKADFANISSALASTGFVWLAPGEFYIDNVIDIPHKATLWGSGGTTPTGTTAQTRVYCVTSTTTPVTNGGFSMHDTAANGGDRNANTSGSIRDLIIDGSMLGSGSSGTVGLDIGDGWGYRLDHVFIENFTNAGAIGLWINNQKYFTEKMRATSVHLRNNTTGCQIGPNILADHSMEYNDLELYFSIGPSGGQAQSGVVLDGSNFTGGSLVMRGNVYQQAKSVPQGIAVLAMVSDKPPPLGTGQSSNLQDTFVDIRIEEDSNGNNTQSIGKVYFDNNATPPPANLSTVSGCLGVIAITGKGTVTTPAAGQFQFRGFLTGSAGIPALRAVTTPAFPTPSGTPVENSQNDAMVYLTGVGTITGIVITDDGGTGVNIGATSGPVYLPANSSITINYSSNTSLGWKWVSCV